VLEEQHSLRDTHVDLLQFACLVLFLDLLDNPHVLWCNVIEFRFDEVVEIHQRNDVGLLAGLYPFLEESVNEGQNRPCGSREDRLRRVVCFLPEVREDLEEQRWLIREERIELEETLAVDVVKRWFGVLFDTGVHEQCLGLVVSLFEDAFRVLFPFSVFLSNRWVDISPTCRLGRPNRCGNRS